MCIFICFCPVYLPKYVWTPYYADREIKNPSFPIRNICAHSRRECSVLKSSEVEMKDVEVLARSSLLLYSICSGLKSKQRCSVYSSLKNPVVTRGHQESFLPARWLQGQVCDTALFPCGTQRRVCLLSASCVVINSTQLRGDASWKQQNQLSPGFELHSVCVLMMGI